MSSVWHSPITITVFLRLIYIYVNCVPLKLQLKMCVCVCVFPNKTWYLVWLLYLSYKLLNWKQKRKTPADTYIQIQHKLEMISLMNTLTSSAHSNNTTITLLKFILIVAITIKNFHIFSYFCCVSMILIFSEPSLVLLWAALAGEEHILYRQNRTKQVFRVKLFGFLFWNWGQQMVNGKVKRI